MCGPFDMSQVLDTFSLKEEALKRKTCRYLLLGFQFTISAVLFIEFEAKLASEADSLMEKLFP